MSVVESVGTISKEMIQDIDISKIEADPNNPRREFGEDALVRLTESIKDNRLLSMLTVVPIKGTDRFVLSRGERRWRALQKLGVSSVTCLVVNIDDEFLIQEIAILDEHFQVNLRPIERAMHYRRIMDTRGWSASQLASNFKVDPIKVGRDLSLLKLETSVQILVQDKKISVGAAEQLCKLKPKQQIRIADQAVREKLDKKGVMEIVKPLLKKRTTIKKDGRIHDFHVGNKTVVTVKSPENFGSIDCLSALIHASDSALSQIFAERDAAQPNLSLETIGKVFLQLSKASNNLKAAANTATSKLQGITAALLFELSRHDNPATRNEWTELLNFLPTDFKLYMRTLRRK